MSKIHHTKIIMRKSARVFISIFSVLFFFSFLLSVFAPTTHAQTTSSTTYSPSNMLQMNADETVPYNQHTYTQAMLIEGLSALTCALTGIDPINPKMPCLNVDPVTNKLSYKTSGYNNEERIGGVLGATAGMIGYLYTPSISSSEYIRYLSDNFGIVKTAHAAPPNGFEGLRVIIELWKSTRNMAYFLLALFFIFMGIGVMLRIRIDPRTVMSLQNQIPNAIIAIILITFSYPLFGLAIDTMWLITYTGVNVIGAADPTPIGCNGGTTSVTQEATTKILQTPIGYVTSLFMNKCGDQGGIQDLTIKVANAVGLVVRDAIHSLLIPDNSNSECHIFTGRAGLAACLGHVFGAFFDWMVRIIMLIIVFVAIVVALFKTWWELLKAYVQVLVYAIIAPVYIVFGLLPGHPLGFGKLARGVGANLLAFPLTAWLFEGARVITDKYDAGATEKFIPPLVGNPHTPNFGAIIAFGFILLAPTVVSLMKEKLKAPSTKQTAAMAAGFLGAGAAVGGFANKNWKHLNRRDQRTGQPLGILAVGREKMHTAGLRAIPGIGGRMAAQRQYQAANQGARGTRAQINAAASAGTIDNQSYLEKFRKGRKVKKGFTAAKQEAQQKGQNFNYTENEAGMKRWQLDNELAGLQTQYNKATTADAKQEIANKMAPLQSQLANMRDAGLINAPAAPAATTGGTDGNTTNAPATSSPTATHTGEAEETGEAHEGEAAETSKEMTVDTLILHTNSVQINGKVEGADAGGHFNIDNPETTTGRDVLQGMRRDGAPDIDFTGHEDWADESYEQIRANKEWSDKFDKLARANTKHLDPTKFTAPPPPPTTPTVDPDAT